MTGCAADINADGEKFDSVDFHCPISKTRWVSLKNSNNTRVAEVMAQRFFAEKY
jgi:hypothetical protein